MDPIEAGLYRIATGPALRPQESDFERRKQKALDDLRAMVSPKVWEQIKAYVQAMLDTATPATLNGVIEDLKVEAKLTQDIENLRHQEEEAHNAHMQDSLVLSPEVTEKLHGDDPLHGYEASAT